MAPSTAIDGQLLLTVSAGAWGFGLPSPDASGARAVASSGLIVALVAPFMSVHESVRAF